MGEILSRLGTVTGFILPDGRNDERGFIFEDGEILVTTMTSPSMMPLAKKAAAIVTNEGGICSHAAIVSREFGIPCIVGTGNATRTFKDGDIIEVNATEGKARLVKKRENITEDLSFTHN